MEDTREAFSLEKYLSNGVDRIVTGIMKASIRNPKASLFLIRHGADSRKARKIREEAEERGEHIPPFLIASITNRCNLHCKGCYARANKSCSDQGNTAGMMKGEDWGHIFSQAEALGIEFILLAGGEPFVREDVLSEAGKHRRILFPVFTNGTMIEEPYIEMLQKNPNLLPVISIEGNEGTTDERRGAGIYQKLQCVMQKLQKQGILFGASITVTKQNMEEVLSDSFVKELEGRGTKGIVYVEYVPVNDDTQELAPDDEDREKMKRRLAELREGGTDLVLVSFPGDEKTSGGCLAAGRGFFHINAFGGAEPCPFSPYSDTNLKNTALRQALQSPLFCSLRSNGNLTEHHIGGCVLFEQKEQVERLLLEGRT
ncbi:MAG: radical SAM protein [Lachnospiraceae bacterium]|nr:radical SAM protein [Lachnospiraceae bacterium]